MDLRQLLFGKPSPTSVLSRLKEHEHAQEKAIARLSMLLQEDTDFYRPSERKEMLGLLETIARSSDQIARYLNEIESRPIEFQRYTNIKRELLAHACAHTGTFSKQIAVLAADVKENALAEPQDGPFGGETPKQRIAAQLIAHVVELWALSPHAQQLHERKGIDALEYLFTLLTKNRSKVPKLYLKDAAAESKHA